jgi:hypothetical protein
LVLILAAPRDLADDRQGPTGGATAHRTRIAAPGTACLLDNLAAIITVVPVTTLAFLLPRCEAALRDAVASRNGSTRDTHILALAWSVESDIWTTDRDFAGTGVPTWSTPNLLRSLVGALQGPGSGPDV